METYRKIETFKIPKYTYIIPVIIAIIFLGSKCTEKIKSGSSGVIYRTLNGGIDLDQEPLGEGLHFVAPWNEIITYEIRQQELVENMQVLSSNGLEIALETSAWFLPQKNKLAHLHKEKGKNYIDRIIKPAIRSASRSVVGRYTPEQLYSSKRDIIQQEIYTETKKILDKQYIQLNEILVRDVELPPTIKTAIERKLKQEQEALEYEFRIAKAKKEAERQRIDAEGKAAANRILSASLTDKILQEKGIEATIKLSESQNSKVIVIGSGEKGMPIILGNK